MGHVFARVSGYGLTLVPIWPYRFERGTSAPGTVTVAHGDGAVRTASVRGPAHRPFVELSGAGSVDQVVDLSPGPERPEWWIETSLYSVVWPAGFRIESPPDDGGPSMFDLHGPGGALIYVQGPFADDRLPAPDQLVAPGQVIVKRRRERDVEVVELEYVHEGESWRQGYWLVPLTAARSLLVTAQAPVGRAVETVRAGDLVALSVRGR